MWQELKQRWQSEDRPGWRFVCVFAGAGFAAFIIFARTLYANEANGGDWLQFFGGALGAILAVFGASFVADLTQGAALRRDRGSAISEVLTATERAFEVYGKAVTEFPGENWKSVLAAGICAEASQVRMTLDRLLARPTLTDGAIEVGAGSIALMDTVMTAGEIFFESNGLNFGSRAAERLSAGNMIVSTIEVRRAKVRAYGVRKGYLKAAPAVLPAVAP